MSGPEALAKVLDEHATCGSRTEGDTTNWECGITTAEGWPYFLGMSRAHLTNAIAPLLAAEREAGAAEVRARVEAVITKWVDNHYFVDTEGRVRHVLYNELRAALNGGE